jgi:hypothetical protein
MEENMLLATGAEPQGARGFLHLHNRHLDPPVYLSVANGLEFDVLAQLERPSTTTR